MKYFCSLCLLVLVLGCASLEPDVQPESTEDVSDAFEISFGSDEHFDLITWNIETFPKHSRTVDFARRSLLGLQPDVLAVQEIWSLEALQELTNLLPGYGIFTPPDMEDTGLAYLYNTATVTIVEPAYRIFVEDNYDFSYRPPYVLKVRFNDSELTIINFHLKCCGDGIIGTDYWDEELRRKNAAMAIQNYIQQDLSDQAVIVVGDWNDSIDEPEASNVFWALTQDTDNFRFADMSIAVGDESQWSFPYYPSHIDHILITNELFDAFDKPDSKIQTLKIEDALPGALDEYWQYLSDHRPVGLKLAL